MGRILLIVVLLIVYGTLYPFDFHARQPGPGPLWTLFHSWPGTLNRFLVRDSTLNILIYLPVGLFGSLWLRQHKSPAVATCGAVLFGAALSSSLEMTQLFDDSRQCSTGDLAMNAVGAALGTWLAWAYGKSIARTVAGVKPHVLEPSGPLLLLCCWVGYQVYPAIPQVSIWQFGAKLKLLWPPWPFSVVQTVGSLIDWLAAASLLDALDAARFLPVLILLLPGRMLLLGRNWTWPEAMGAMAALVLWRNWVAGYKNRPMLLAWSAVVVLLLRGLRPFTWQVAAAEFSWVPFASFLTSDQGGAALMFLDKSFLYGTALWLLREAGYGWRTATIGLVALLGTIEAMQIHLPGRTPEITDPVYAIILAAVLKARPAPRHTVPYTNTELP